MLIDFTLSPTQFLFYSIIFKALPFDAIVARSIEGNSDRQSNHINELIKLKFLLEIQS